MHASQQEVAIYQTLKRWSGEWLGSKRVAEEAGVTARTARHHLLRFVRLGIAEVNTALFPNHHYRLIGKAPRIEAAASVSNADRRRDDETVESVVDSWARR